MGCIGRVRLLDDLTLGAIDHRTGRTNYIFVDFENFQEYDLDGIAHKPIKVTLVLGWRHKSLPVQLVKLIQKYASQLALVEIALEGKNALDFVIACLIGAEAERDPQGYFHVLSRDTGFDALICHLKSRGIRAARHVTFSQIPVLMNAAERVKLLTQFFTANAANRPKKRPALDSEVQALFGKTLSSADIQETIQKLIHGKILTPSDNGAVSYAA
jgi:hypothetical protein